MRTPLLEFRNRLCILRSIDQHELVEAGVLEADDTLGWMSFRDGPYDAFLKLDDERVARLWALMDARS